MKKIFERTFETTLKLANIVVVTLISIICSLIVISAYDGESIGTAFSVLLNNTVTLQNLIFFFCLTGVLLMVITSSTFTGLIATEVHEGTIKLLAAKSNSRTEILIAKVLGGFAGMAALLVLEIFVYFATIVISGKLDNNILFELTKYIPAYLLYGLIIIIIFGGLSTLLSCILKKKVLALLPMLALSILIIAFYPMTRVTSDLIGQGSSIGAIFDFNYQLALIYKTCLSIVGPIKGSETQLTLYAYFTKLFVTQSVDSDITLGGYELIITENTSLNNYITLVAYLLFSAACYFMSSFIFKKKDL